MIFHTDMTIWEVYLEQEQLEGKLCPAALWE